MCRSSSQSCYIFDFEICKFLDVGCYKYSNSMVAPLISIKNMKKQHLFKFQNQDFGLYDDKINHNIIKFTQDINNKFHNYELSYMRRQRKSNSVFFKIKNSISSGLIENLKDIKHNLGWYLISKYNPINPYQLGFFTRKLIRSKRKKNLLNKFILSKDEALEDLNYVYFPLHFEPERTTLSDGDFFHDQFLALVHLRNILPDNITIIIKEHPSQFYMSDKGSRGRSPLIYNLFKKIKGIKIAGVEISTVKLIRNSKFVSTITGTVALESAIIGKPALTFGSTWYDGCPNIYNWHNNISYDDIVEAEIKNTDSIVDFLIELKNKFFIPAYMNFGQQLMFPEYNVENFNKLQNDNLYKLMKYFLKI